MTEGDYAELHCHSNFSFLDGASHPEELANEAARLGLSGLALTDHDGFYGVVRFAEAARQHGVPTIFGAELTLGLTKRQVGVADPAGTHLVVLARDPIGYAHLGQAIGDGQLAGHEKGRPSFDLATLATSHGGHWLVLTGCRKGMVPAALIREGPAAALRVLDELIDTFGREHVVVELWNHDDPLDTARNDALAALAVSREVLFVATSNVHYATPDGHSLAVALAALRACRSLDEMDGWLPVSPSAHLRSAREQARRFARYPGAVERAGEIGRELAFDLHLVAPGLPPFPTPTGKDEMTYLCELVEAGAITRYGPRHVEQITGAWRQIDYELAVIEQLDFPGYFLVVWDIVRFCREHDIFCQGRGSAANSAVCYALGITNADAVQLGLIFERFLSPERDGPPDIDVDIESGRREEVIQYVYARHGRRYAAQVANVITYRPRSAVRDAARVLGYPPGAMDRWSRQLERHGHLDVSVDAKDRHGELVHDIPPSVMELASRLDGMPRHLGVHSGGMVMCDRPISQVCPIEWATAADRTVLQWDKEDCATAGLVKFDLLGLGMLEALHRIVDLVAEFYDVVIDLATISQEDAVYEMLCNADTVGVFQVESRAQMGTLPRLKPRIFYDLVVEVALIRPGPIQGGSVHPYLRRRNNEEKISYPHHLLESCLKRTLGVPLFQEQLMQMAVDAAGFSAAEADKLRQAMGSKRSNERMEALRERFYAGMAERDITGSVADDIYSKMAAFANFGFPESHAVSFAHLVYSSAWLKLHYPAAFCVGLLNSQPMGFWAPRTLVADARRHGVEVCRPDVRMSGVQACLEHSATSPGQPALRLGLNSIRHLGTQAAERIVAGRPYEDLEDLARRTQLREPQLEALATADALHALGHDGRRAGIWAAGVVARSRPGQFAGMLHGTKAPELPAMDSAEELVADLWATGVSVDSSLTELVRPELIERGVMTASELRSATSGSRVVVAGVVTHRQRPETAGGVTFVNLEDETGLVNVVCSKGVWVRYRAVVQSAAAMIIRGRVESTDGVVNVVAERIEELELAAVTRSRDFS